MYAIFDFISDIYNSLINFIIVINKDSKQLLHEYGGCENNSN